MSQRNSQPGVFLVLKKEYADLQHYQSAKENSLQLNMLFQELCSNFLATFQALSSTALIPMLPTSPSRLHSYPSVSCLTQFALDFSSLMREVADYHIVCLNRQREHNRPDFQVYLEFAQELQGVNAASEQMEASKVGLDSLFKQIKLDFIAYRKNTEDPIKYYDGQYVQKTNETLRDEIEEATMVSGQLGERRGRLTGKVNALQGFLSRLKCKLVKNKYGVLKQVRQFVHNGHSCLAQVSQLLKECVLTHKGLFLQARSSIEEPSQLKEMLNRSTEISIQHPIDQNRRWEVAIRTTLDACCQENQAVERVLQQFEQYFTSVWQGYQERKRRVRVVVARLSQFYEAGESPLQALLGLVGLQDQLQEQLRMVGGRVMSLRRSLGEHKHACLKDGEIVLSLLKIKNKRRQGLLDAQDGNTRRNLSQLVAELAATTPKDQIIAFYDSWLAAQREVTQTMRQMVRPRSKSATDSMEASISQTRQIVQRKRPLREEMWLWRDPVQQVADNTDEYLNYFQQVRKFAAQMEARFGEKEGVELQKYECVLSKKPATLTITTSGMGVSAADSNIRLGWKDVLSLQPITNFFDKGVAVDTPQGKIELLRLSKPVETVLSAIRQAQEKGMMGKVKVQARQQVVLTPDEVQRIQARRKQINSEVPTTDDYKLIVGENLEGVRIDEVYQWVYSDQPFNLYGREEPCFFSYTGKKAGNINWQADKYDRPGPYFYSLQKGITFQNCPLFSVRKISYNHPMKPSSIPFMPKLSRNEDQRRMYWLSHQELLYHIKSLTYDVPMADNFEVHLLHRITALPSATRVEIYSQVKFVKQTSFKNIIFSNTDPEIDENMLGFMAEVTKLFRIRKEAAQGGEVPIEPEPTTPQVTADVGEVEKLRGYNRLLIGALLLVLLVELLRILLA